MHDYIFVHCLHSCIFDYCLYLTHTLGVSSLRVGPCLAFFFFFHNFISSSWLEILNEGWKEG